MAAVRTQYNLRVDRHIYGPPSGEGCQTVDDWIQLALAALDQGGFSLSFQNRIYDQVKAMADMTGLPHEIQRPNPPKHPAPDEPGGSKAV